VPPTSGPNYVKRLIIGRYLAGSHNVSGQVLLIKTTVAPSSGLTPALLQAVHHFGNHFLRHFDLPKYHTAYATSPVILPVSDEVAQPFLWPGPSPQ
jgi:hypothetical protein